jgi:hypothetical protein
VLAADPRYRAILEAWVTLQQDLVSDPLNAARILSGTQSLDTLYEKWVTLSIVDVCSHLLCIDPDALSSALAEAWLRLNGIDRDLPLILKSGGHNLEIWIQHEIGCPWDRVRSPTGLLATPRRAKPDALINISLAGRAPKWIAYDAKLRLDDDGYPPSDALDDLAFYREAIRGPDGQERILERAHAVFPGQMRKTEHPYDRARAYGVGAIPLLPSVTDWLVAEFKDLIK